MTGQALTFGGAMALGGVLGLVYDLFRLLRRRLDWKALGILLDLLYWPLVAVSIFVYAVAAGDGVVRVYLMLGVAVGGGLYFLLLSWAALLLGGWIADLAAFLWALALCPVRWSRRALKKFSQNAKKIFHYRLKWYKINCTIGAMGRMARMKGGGGHADQKSGDPHQAGGTHPAHRFRRQSSGASGPARPGRSRKRSG